MGACASSCCMRCCCYACFLDTYLHVHVRTIKNLKASSDINIAGTNDVYIKCNYMGIIQETRIQKGEKGSVVVDEPLIFENARQHRRR